MNKETYLDRARELRAATDVHYNCAQSVLIPFAEECGMSREEAFRVAANFGSGMRVGAVCGAVTGALMAMGLAGKDDPALVSKLIRKVKRNHDGLIDCRDLLRVNHELGREQKPHCDDMVYECVGLVCDLMEE